MSESQYIVSARKYRPSTFKSVVGQKNLTDTLKNTIDSGRLAQAYLFCGPRGVGKTSCARIFAKTINCLTPTPDGEACGHCESCRAVDEGNSFNIIELDAASNNSVDDIRNITEQVNIPPTIGKYRVFIIDEVHMLSSQAFNAFLKTLEEPPSYVVFILATTEKHKVIPTILSRCQIYDFKRITIQDTVEHLQYVASEEGIEADVAALNVIAKKADGAMRDALSIFDQVAASSVGKITYESAIASLNVLDYEFYFRLVDAFRRGDVQDALMIYKEIRDRGFDSLFFVNGLASHIRDLMVAYSPQTAILLEVADDIASRYTEQAKSLPIDWHYAAMRLLNDCETGYRTSSNKQFLVELTLIRLCQLLNPPTPPFDRVDSDYLELRDPAIPPTAASVHTSPSVTPTAPSVTPSSPATAKPHGQAEHPTSQANSNPPAAPDESAGDAPIQRKTVRGHRKENTSAPTDKPSGISSQFEQKREPVNDEMLRDIWREYADRHPDKQILVSAMRNTIPHLVENEKMRVLVDHPAIRQAFESSMQDLVMYMRSALHNDFLTLDVEIDSSKSGAKMVPPQELLKEIVDSNPLIASLIADIDGELA